MYRESRRYTPSGDSLGAATQYRNIFANVIIPENTNYVLSRRMSKLENILKRAGKSKKTPTLQEIA